MGGTNGLINPDIPIITKELFMKLSGANYSESLFNSMRNKDGIIEEDTFLSFTGKIKDVFISHDWGIDELGRENHNRAAQLNKALLRKGLRVWFDSERMNGDTQVKINEGINQCACVIILITKNYIEKTAGKGEKGTFDNCYYQFSYANELKERERIFPVVTEPRCRDNSSWYGRVGQVLVDMLYTDFTSDDGFDDMVDNLYEKIMSVIKSPIEERIKNFFEDYKTRIQPKTILSSFERISWEDITCEKIENVIGEGSFAFVVKAKWKNKRNITYDVAVKVFNSRITDKYEDICNKAIKEAKMCKSIYEQMVNKDLITLVHGVVMGPLTSELSNVFKLHDKTEKVGIVMRLEVGGSLDSLLHPTGVKRLLSLQIKVAILKDISDSLRDLHSIGGIHGDIKPSNVLLSDLNNYKIRLADFGLSDIREIKDIGRASTIHKTENTKGTRAYCAPEMLENPNVDDELEVAKASRRTDIYAFGILIWEVFSEKRPFIEVGNKEIALCRKIHRGERPPESDLQTDVPPGIVELMKQCWDSDRDKRPTAVECYTTLFHTHSILSSGQFDIFFSHAWVDKYVLSHVFVMLSSMGYRVWYDQNDMGYDLHKSMRDGIVNSKVVLVCVNSTYQDRPNCMFELEEAIKMNKTLVALVLEDMYDNCWTPSDQLKDSLNFTSKMYCDISKVVKDPAWKLKNSNGDLIEPPKELLNEMKLALSELIKILSNVRCESSCSTNQYHLIIEEMANWFSSEIKVEYKRAESYAKIVYNKGIHSIEKLITTFQYDMLFLNDEKGIDEDDLEEIVEKLKSQNYVAKKCSTSSVEPIAVQEHSEDEDGYGFNISEEPFWNGLSEKATRVEKDLHIARAAADEVMEEINKAVSNSLEWKKEVDSIKHSITVNEKNIIVYRQEIEGEFAEYQPIIGFAKQRIDSIEAEKLNEIRSLISPPPKAVADVLTAVLMIFDMQDLSWQSMKNFFSNRWIIEDILNYDTKRLLSGGLRVKIGKLLKKNPASFDDANIQTVSVVAASLASWVKAQISYSLVIERIVLLEADLEEEVTKLEQSRRRLEKCEDELKEVDDSVNALNKEFLSRETEVKRLKSSVEALLFKVYAAADVVNDFRTNGYQQKFDMRIALAAANKAMEEIIKAISSFTEQRSEADEFKRIVAEIEEKVKARKQEIERSELSEIQSILYSAKQAVVSIKAEHLNEIRSLSAPPQEIADVLAAVLMMLGVQDLSWQSMKKFLSKRGAKEDIYNYNAKRISGELRKNVGKLLKKKPASFDDANIQTVSVAAASLASWVKAEIRYSLVIEKIEPLQEELEEEETKLEQSQRRLEKCEDELKEIDDRVAKLNKEFKSRTIEAQRLRSNLSHCGSILDIAEKRIVQTNKLQVLLTTILNN